MPNKHATSVGRDETPDVDFATVSKIIAILEPLTDDGRRHALATVATWYRLAVPVSFTGEVSQPSMETANVGLGKPPDEKFGGRQEITPKDFLFEKDPGTDVERLACLAYYLTHFRSTPHFKTEDLSKLNMEAAQRRFANTAFTAKNAMRDGFLVPAAKTGSRQLSAMGERYVQALPDRHAANEVRRRSAVRRVKRASSSPLGDNGTETVGADKE